MGGLTITRKTRIYVAGCGGMLGEAVYERFAAIATTKATDIDLNEPWLERADVRDYRQMEAAIQEFRPDAIINLAALTDLELCETQPENAWLTNALGAENLGLIANELDVPYVYISTAGIFDGKKHAYTEFDEPAPLSVYGRSKCYGEMWVRQHVRRHYVLRAGWMMGGGLRKDKKFVVKIYKQLLAGRRELTVVDDKLGSPTYTHEFAEGMQRFLESGLYGLYNQACAGAGSRFEVATELVRLLGLERAVKIEQVGSDRFNREYFAPRPQSEALLSMKHASRGFPPLRHWRECLANYVESLRREAPIHLPTSVTRLPVHGTHEMDVGVVIPGYNGERFIANALESILSQTVPPKRIVVVDDGSPDAMMAVVERYGGNVCCVRQNNAGMSAARNRGVQELNTEWVAFLDQDDVWLPRKLEMQLAEASRTGLPAVLSSVQIVDQELRALPLEPVRTPKTDLLSLLRRSQQMPQGVPSSLLVRRDVLNAIGGFDEQLGMCADWDILIRLRVAVEFAYVNEPLVLYRRHDANVSRKVELLERDSISVLEKAFSSRMLPEAIRRQRRACEAWNDMVLAGSYYRSGARLRSVWLSARGLWRDPRLANRVVGFPARWLRTVVRLNGT